MVASNPILYQVVMWYCNHRIVKIAQAGSSYKTSSGQPIASSKMGDKRIPSAHCAALHRKLACTWWRCAPSPNRYGKLSRTWEYCMHNRQLQTTESSSPGGQRCLAQLLGKTPLIAPRPFSTLCGTSGRRDAAGYTRTRPWQLHSWSPSSNRISKTGPRCIALGSSSLYDFLPCKYFPALFFLLYFLA